MLTITLFLRKFTQGALCYKRDSARLEGNQKNEKRQVKKMNKKLLAATIASSAIVAPYVLSTDVVEAAALEMTIFHTNDTHAHVETAGQRAALVKQLRSTHPNNLLLDAGDVFSGTLYFNEWKGQADLEIMNYLQYDAMTFGNHEFDLGLSPEGHGALADFVKGAKFPFVSANVDFSNDALFEGLQPGGVTTAAQDGQIYDGIIKEVNGEKVGIFGLTTEETTAIASPEKVEFKAYLSSAQQAVENLKAQGVNKIIALTHIGFDDSLQWDNDQELAKQVAGIDVIVGGHTHTELKEPVKVINEQSNEPVIIVQANQYNKYVGQLDITFNDSGVVEDYKGQLNLVGEKDKDGKYLLPSDAEADKILAKYAEKVNATMNASTGADAKVFLSGLRGFGGVRAGETNLGNIITDGMLDKAKKIDPAVSIAFQNGGGIRTSINKGDVTYGEVLNVLPFGNPLAIVELTGAELYETFEHSVKDYPKESGGFLHVAGMKVIFDPNKEPGKRIVSLKVGDQDVDRTASYKAATNVFTARGGDGFEALGKAYEEGRASEPGFSDWENFATRLGEIGDVTQQIEGRIVTTTTYKDVDVNHWAYPFIANLQTQGILKPLPKFNGNNGLTRAQVAEMLTRALNLEAKGDAPLKDIAGVDATTKQAIAAAYEAGIVKGVDGKFNPNKKITRAQMALMFERAYKTVNATYTSPTATFKDTTKLNDETRKAIGFLEDNAIANGDAGNYNPAKNVTRNQAAKLFFNLLYTVEQFKQKK